MFLEEWKSLVMSKSSLFHIKTFLIQRRMSVILIVFAFLTVLYGFSLKGYAFQNQIIWFECISFFLFHAFFTIILNRIHKFYHSRSAISIVYLSTLVFFSLLYLIFVFEYSNFFYESQSFYSIYVNHSFILRGLFSFLILLSVANQFWIDKHLLDEEKRNWILIEHEKKFIQSELTNLKQQFQPHFLFNALNSISALVGSQPEEARRMILLLSEFLRHSIRKRDEDFETLEQEFQFLNLYLEIEKIRFGHRLTIQQSIDESLNEVKIPNQILQPLMENAIKYGLYGNLGNLKIEIEIKQEESGISISIANPFEENSVKSSKGTGYGLKFVEQKLKILYKRNDLLQVSKTTDSFRARIFIPNVMA